MPAPHFRFRIYLNPWLFVIWAFKRPMEVNDGPSEWEAIMSVEEKQDEIRRLTVRSMHSVLSAVIKPFVCCHPSDVC